MSNDIKTVYKDKSGRAHDTRAQARKANRLIDAAAFLSQFVDNTYDGDDSLESRTGDLLGGVIDEVTPAIIEYARAVVAIFGMKDKAPKSEEAK